MHIFAVFVTTATAVRLRSLPTAPVPLVQRASSTLAVVRQRPTQEAVPPLPSIYPEVHPSTDRTALPSFVHLWTHVAPPPKTCIV